MVPALTRTQAHLGRIGEEALPLLARLTFAGVLLTYFWKSALTKTGPGIFGWLHPSAGAYAQIFPRQLEAAGYDPSALGAWPWAVTTAGTLAEFVLPALILLGLATRPAALGMMAFIAVQSLTDIIGHGADSATIGRLFDRDPGSLIADQRALWGLCVAVLLFKGAGALSLDRLLARRLGG
ncbi:DoxX family protein [Pseudoroseicyclus sp. CXY001]|uniref:DoxX family protein n=1 Tax=Pseudoroseicyclus sp. CXY001 TaxID=3242492 RepID=UPI0035713F19